MMPGAWSKVMLSNFQDTLLNTRTSTNEDTEVESMVFVSPGTLGIHM